MARYKNYINGGVLLPADLNATEDDYETAFSSYRNVFLTPFSAVLIPTDAAQIWILSATHSAVPVDAGSSELWLDPADFVSAGRTARLRLRLNSIVNAVAPGITFTVGLYPIATFAGTSGNNPTDATLSAVVAGSQAAIASPAAASSPVANGADFACPAAGWYVVGLLTSGVMPANSQVYSLATLQMRQT